jgi:hypothetical protein
MFTPKSLIVSFALILALVCTGVVATSAHTDIPAQKQLGGTPYPKGITAISLARGNHNLLSFLDVRRYLNTKGFIGGSTLTGQTPALQDLQLTNILHLDYLLHFLIPEQPGNELVYYAHIDGPLLVLPDLPLPVLSTLLPSLDNLPALLPHLGNLSWLGLLTASNGSLYNILPLPRMPDLSHLQSRIPAPSHLPQKRPVLHHVQSSSHVKSNSWSTVLDSAYEVFDAHSGNLLAWG